MSQATLDQVRSVLLEQLGVDESEVTLEALLDDDFAADAIDQVEIIMALEQLYNITIPDELAERVKTVADLVALVEQRVAVAEETRDTPAWKKGA